MLIWTGLSIDRLNSKAEMENHLSPAPSSDPMLTEQNFGNYFSVPGRGEHGQPDGISILLYSGILILSVN